MPARRFILALASLSAFIGLSAAAAEPLASEQIQGGRDLSARLTVPVTINGGGPYHFVVDTGSERTVISRELATRLTLAIAAPVTVAGVAGSDEVATAIVPQLRLLSSRTGLSDLRAPLLAETHLGAVGMLGIDSLQSKRVILDFKTMRMSVSDAQTRRAPPRDDDEIVVTARRRLGQLILVDAEIDGEPISVVVDTGSAVSIGNSALRRRLVRSGSIKLGAPIEIRSVTGAHITAPYSWARHIRIGGVNIETMQVAFSDADIFQRLGLARRPALLLGMDVLSQFDRVSIDFANRTVRFLLPGDAWRTPPPRLAGEMQPHLG